MQALANLIAVFPASRFSLSQTCNFGEPRPGPVAGRFDSGEI
jgi:hypothetical protein